MRRIRLVLSLVSAALSGCVGVAPHLTEIKLEDKAAFENWANSKIGRVYPQEACLRNGRNEGCGLLVESRTVAGDVEQVHRPMPNCQIAFVEARNNSRIVRWRYVSAPEQCWVALPTELRAHANAGAGTPYVDRRAPTQEDLAAAREALREFLPEEHTAYSLSETGVAPPFNTRFVAFSTTVVDNVRVVSRAKRVSCWKRNQSWNCYGPSVWVFFRGHSFPEPAAIDDKTIAEIVDYIASRCVYAQARELQQQGKWIGPPIGTGSLRIRGLRQSGTGYSVKVGSAGSGNDLGIKRSEDTDSKCPFQILGVGYYVSMMPNHRIEPDRLAAAHAER